MNDHLTEEEQIEQLKRLWKEYGATIIASVVIATGGYLGWNYYQGEEQQKAERASAFYEQLLTSVRDTETTSAEDSARDATAAHLTEQIKQTDSESFYAAQGAFFAAKEAVQKGNLDEAQTQLEWVVNQFESPELTQIARLRLARVLGAKGEYDAALSQLSGEPLTGFAALHNEVRGDLLRESGDNKAALSAYQTALSALGSDQQQQRGLLEMKLNQLKPAEAVEEPTA